MKRLARCVVWTVVVIATPAHAGEFDGAPEDFAVLCETMKTITPKLDRGDDAAHHEANWAMLSDAFQVHTRTKAIQDTFEAVAAFPPDQRYGLVVRTARFVGAKAYKCPEIERLWTPRWVDKGGDLSYGLFRVCLAQTPERFAEMQRTQPLRPEATEFFDGVLALPAKKRVKALQKRAKKLKLPKGWCPPGLAAWGATPAAPDATAATVAKPQVMGSLPADEVSKVLTSETLTACAPQGAPGAKVRLKWVIESKGGVTTAKVKGGNGGRDLEQCLVKAVKGLKFPAPPGGGIVVVSWEWRAPSD